MESKSFSKEPQFKFIGVENTRSIDPSRIPMSFYTLEGEIEKLRSKSLVRLMYDNLEIAKTDLNFQDVLLINTNAPQFFIPQRFLQKKWITYEELLNWSAKRLIIPAGTGRNPRALHESYDFVPLFVIETTRVCSVTDGWWLSFSEEDSFRKDTTRGKAGFPEWDPQTFTLKK